jgi:hypothetical protein
MGLMHLPSVAPITGRPTTMPEAANDIVKDLPTGRIVFGHNHLECIG